MTLILQVRKNGAQRCSGTCPRSHSYEGEGLRISHFPSSGFSIGPSCPFHLTNINGDRCCVGSTQEWGWAEPGPGVPKASCRDSGRLRQSPGEQCAGPPARVALLERGCWALPGPSPGAPVLTNGAGGAFKGLEMT